MSSSIGQNPTLLLSITHVEILSWIIDVWIEKHSASDNNCNTMIYNPLKSLQTMTNNVGLTFSVGDTIPRFITSIEQDN